MTEREQQWKCGNEFAPFNRSASHVDPAYRDGWNACYTAALAARAVQPQDVVDARRLDWLESMAMKPGGLLLHSGSETTGRTGLGLRPGIMVRTLREAIDAAMPPPSDVVGSGEET